MDIYHISQRRAGHVTETLVELDESPVITLVLSDIEKNEAYREHIRLLFDRQETSE